MRRRVAGVLTPGGALPAVEGFLVDARTRAEAPDGDGGDWYDVVALPHGRLAVAIGDVAGRGAPAAATKHRLRDELHARLAEGASPRAALAAVNRLAQDQLPGEVATALVVEWHRDDERVSVTCAGHPPPLVVGNGAARYLAVERGPALGLLDYEFPESVHAVPTGLALLLFTDGLVERRGELIDLGLARLADAAAHHHGAAAFLDRLVDEVPDPNEHDDIAVIAVSRTGE